MYDRSNDIAPYWGGARITIGNKGCTAGFPVRTYDGWGGMLTAAHCGNYHDPALAGDGPDVIGFQAQTSTKRDSMILRAADSMQPRVYIGDPKATYGAEVIGMTKLYFGNYFCTDGAKTGYHCGIQVTYTGMSGYNEHGWHLQHMAVGTQKDGGCAGARGDSGGPIVVPTSQFSKKKAGGTISGGIGPHADCPYGGQDGRSKVFSHALPMCWPSSMRP